MWRTCIHAEHMSKMIQIRHVPDELHRKLKSRAALEGLSLSEFALRELRSVVERPSLSEWLERVGRRKPVLTDISAAEIIRAERDSR